MTPSDSLGALLTWIGTGLRRTLGRYAARTDPHKRRLHDSCRYLDVAALLAQPVNDARFVVIDTETTGFHAYAGDEIVSIALLELRGLEPTGREYCTEVNPGRPIPSEVSAIHGIRDDDVRDKPFIDEIFPDVIEFIGDAVVVGHHVAFDMRFLNKNLQKTLLCRLRNPCVDTMCLYTGYTGRLGHYSLEEVAEFCRVSIHQRHSARGDAVATAQIFSLLCKTIVNQDQPVRQLLTLQKHGAHAL